MLFPIGGKKLLFKRPGKEGFFGKIKINIKIEDFLNSKSSFQASTPINNSAQINVNSSEVGPEGQKNNHDLPSNSSRKSL